MPEKVEEGLEEVTEIAQPEAAAIEENTEQPDVTEPEPSQEEDEQKATEPEVVSPTGDKRKGGRRKSSDSPHAKRARVKDNKTPERLSRRLKNQKSGSKLPEIKDGDALLPKTARRKSSSSSSQDKTKTKNGDAHEDLVQENVDNISDEKPAEELPMEAFIEQPQPVDVA